jgi:hypothetical protein
MTKTDFLREYRKQLLAMFPWAQDTGKLGRFMLSVHDTLNGANTWNHDGEAVTQAYKQIGGKGKPSLKALRGLPD